MVRCDNASDRGMDRKPDNGSLRLGAASPLSDPRSGWSVWFIRRIRSMGIRDQPTSPRSPWQNGYAERLIGSIRRECLDHVVVLGECHLRHLLLPYMKYYNGAHASILGEGCAVLARRRTGWTDSLPSNSRRAAPPICSDLIFDRHRFGFGKIFKPIARRIAKNRSTGDPSEIPRRFPLALMRSDPIRNHPI